MKVVTIGGGTGSFHVLLALKRLENVEISAIVSVSDNGGSTGILRTLYGVLPPGDIRSCLVALSNDTEIWARLFNYRFDEKLNEHSLGNLILTALTDLRGSFELALEDAHRILNISGHKVIPVTFYDTELSAKFDDGKVVDGESQINNYKGNFNKKIVSMSVKSKDGNRVYPNPKAIKEILESDFIVLGPGSLYTSIIPNLLIDDVLAAIKKSSAKKIFVVNIMSDSETYNYRAEDFVSEIEKYVSLDYVVVNSKRPNQTILDRYLKENKFFIESENGSDSYVDYDLINEKDILRHDPVKLSRVLEWIFLREKQNLG